MKIVEFKNYNELLNECKAIVAERKFDIAIRDLEWRHELGKTIGNSELYKNAESKTEFIQRIAKDLNASQGLIYQCIEFYKKFPDFDKFISEFKPNKKTLRWADVRLALVEKPENCSHEKTYKETIMITRIKCQNCSKTLKEEKGKIE